MTSFDQNRALRPSSFVGIPEEFLLLIGHIVGAWSQFDISFNRLLGILIDKAEVQKDRWRFLSFDKRCKLLRKASHSIFETYPNITIQIESIISDAKSLQLDRNLICHGHINLKVQTFEVTDNQIPGKVSLRCIGQKAGNTVERTYDEAELEDIRYKFAYLCGRMNSMVKGKNLQKLSLTEMDLRFFLSVLGKN